MDVNLNADDVVSMDANTSFMETSTSTCGELMATLEELVYQHSNLDATVASDWANGGVSCRVLQVKGGWQTGKVRIRIEFISDKQPEISPLHDLRNNL